MRVRFPIVAEVAERAGPPQGQNVIVERPIELDGPIVVFAIGKLFAAEQSNQVRTKVDARRERKLERTPELAVDLHQDEVVSQWTMFEFHHRDAMPFE